MAILGLSKLDERLSNTSFANQISESSQHHKVC